MNYTVATIIALSFFMVWLCAPAIWSLTRLFVTAAALSLLLSVLALRPACAADWSKQPEMAVRQ